MTTLEPEQKDILEKLNQLALEENWGTVDRVNGIPKGVAVIMEAIEEIKRLREQNGEANELCRKKIGDLKINEWIKIMKLAGYQVGAVSQKELIEQVVMATAKDIIEDFKRHGSCGEDWCNYMRKAYGVEIENE